MKTKLILIFLGLTIIFTTFIAKRKYYDPFQKLNKAQNEVDKLIENKSIEEGDIIFQTSLSRQSQAIQLATKSKYSHCGIIFLVDSVYYVLEAVQPVKYTLLEKWIAKGKDGKYVIKRLKNSKNELNKDGLLKMKIIIQQFIGKDYDLTFEWSDSKIYCSELIWKVYKRALNVEIGKLQKLSDFDLSNVAVKSKMKERYGTNIPLNETVISPSSIFESDLLIRVARN